MRQLGERRPADAPPKLASRRQVKRCAPSSQELLVQSLAQEHVGESPAGPTAPGARRCPHRPPAGAAHARRAPTFRRRASYRLARGRSPRAGRTRTRDRGRPPLQGSASHPVSGATDGRARPRGCLRACRALAPGSRQQLAQEQRVPLGPPMDCIDLVDARRGAGRLRHEVGHLTLGQASKRQHRRLAGQPMSASDQRPAPGELQRRDRCRRRAALRSEGRASRNCNSRSEEGSATCKSSSTTSWGALAATACRNELTPSNS